MRSPHRLATGVFGALLVVPACGTTPPQGSGAESDGGPGHVTDTGSAADSPTADSLSPADGAATRKIQHVIMIMQENRSFDHYFGMFPGVDGFTLDAQGNPTDCNPDPNLDGGCVHVFHDHGSRPPAK